MISDLPRLIKKLKNIEPSKTNFLSCYFDISDVNKDFLVNSMSCIRFYRQRLKDQDLSDFEEAFSKVIDFMENDVLPDARGIALFVRPVSGGAFMLPIQLTLPVTNKILLANRPHLFDQHGQCYLPVVERT